MSNKTSPRAERFHQRITKDELSSPSKKSAHLQQTYSNIDLSKINELKVLRGGKNGEIVENMDELNDSMASLSSEIADCPPIFESDPSPLSFKHQKSKP
jgi:hypothetical protein